MTQKSTVQIDPDRLRQLRERKGMKQTKLSEKTLKSGQPINKQTISNIERGKTTKIRRRTLEALAKALGVQAEVLTGEMPMPEESPGVKSSVLDHRVSNASRNALALVSMRYNFPAYQILELAPFLFLHAAEKSLERRASINHEIYSAYQKLENTFFNEAPHLVEIEMCREAFEHIDDNEQYSMHKGDLTAESGKLEYKANTNYRVFDIDAYSDDYMTYYTGINGNAHFGENPFSMYLSSLTNDLQDNIAKFHGIFYGDEADNEEGYIDVTSYQICPDEALKVAEGDEDIANAILDGSIRLHERPNCYLGLFRSDFTAVGKEDTIFTERLKSEVRKWLRKKYAELKAEKMEKSS